SIAGYRKLLEDAIAARSAGGDSVPTSVPLRFIESWHTDTRFISLTAESIRFTDAHVVFTAHSLPARILAEGDPYEQQLLETASSVARRAAIGDWSFSYQSESPTGEPWLQPDILDHLADLRARGVEHVLVCPVGFVA